ncbi:hypothetical protein CEXT_334551 [Caerostris extrusa]|uniref:Uncharacterized protein n=1 Tax=Caerostris extrusa TaxID=172846 RepID=A0AAV4T4H0_CAEEX|nr:hypothetical protein CEXT_334551 [Caerostris extrusa]
MLFRGANIAPFCCKDRDMRLLGGLLYLTDISPRRLQWMDMIEAAHFAKLFQKKGLLLRREKWEIIDVSINLKIYENVEMMSKIKFCVLVHRVFRQTYNVFFY